MKRNSSSTMDTSRIGPNVSSTSGPSMQITSDEVNFLIFRYLQEAGELLILGGYDNGEWHAKSRMHWIPLTFHNSYCVLFHL